MNHTDCDDEVGNDDKCESCGLPPVSDVVDEKHLCADCIEKLGTRRDD